MPSCSGTWTLRVILRIAGLDALLSRLGSLEDKAGCVLGTLGASIITSIAGITMTIPKQL